MRLVRIVTFLAGAALSATAGLIGLSVGIIALLDPVGTQMADDNAPFGTPPGPMMGIVTISVSVVLIVWPLFVWWFRQAKRERN